MSKSHDGKYEPSLRAAGNGEKEQHGHTHSHGGESCSDSHEQGQSHEQHRHNHKHEAIKKAVSKDGKHSHGGHSHDGHHHGHHHGHSHGHHGHSHTPNNKAGLLIALVITAGIMVLEFVGGLVTNSLALLSDSGHMLSDTAALALSLAAMWFAVRPRSSSRTYGFHRFEILAALLNGITLFVIAAFIIVEAFKRFGEPPAVASGTMMIIAGIGLLANLASAWFLMRKADVKDNLNVRSAYLHVIGDAIGSVGAIIAGILMSLFSWYIADPIISVIVALLILKSAWGIIKSTVHILMEGTPANVDADQVEAMLLQIQGVKAVHDLHIWTITSGLDSLSCHLVVEDSVDCQIVLQEAIGQIAEEFQIEHTTIQIEKSQLLHPELKV
ncbi:cation diffusion facilitator family transporter [Paenibacillus sp. LHD-38]|uniref:cation diffusion facilitator family transporter n=1 Tax=Paenibacillus sp. LHD-38 TaxID=3072143 RepID=UPI00280DA943|nr:cation diffusion facilitator family transporter [Paenibacillus sp. LHD-38]MDQ8736451.1 cation diffusion facilitator family transporter [Paenibacillus sp. LHD-38]